MPAIELNDATICQARESTWDPRLLVILACILVIIGVLCGTLYIRYPHFANKN